MADYPENLTDSQRLLREVADLTREVKSVRWYLGLLCLIAAVGVIFFLLWVFGVLTVDVNLARP